MKHVCWKFYLSNLNYFVDSLVTIGKFLIYLKICRVRQFSNFAQWRYSNQWSNREVLLLLVENYNQYPAQTEWNISGWGNFWRLLREQMKNLEVNDRYIPIHRILMLNVSSLNIPYIIKTSHITNLNNDQFVEFG